MRQAASYLHKKPLAELNVRLEDIPTGILGFVRTSDILTLPLYEWPEDVNPRLKSELQPCFVNKVRAITSIYSHFLEIINNLVIDDQNDFLVDFYSIKNWLPGNF
ncbi:unnamed protein product [Meloidogyne enterolobii]|uniref:Uncharacterized protein n=1 Tax=Meloidogyne enterolobii TaxID=390850 RepID=A0ACB1ASE9_MELEN